jgi:hypothetical protein
MYFPRNWEFGLALSKLRNFGGGGGWTPPKPPPSVRHCALGTIFKIFWTNVLWNEELWRRAQMKNWQYKSNCGNGSDVHWGRIPLPQNSKFWIGTPLGTTQKRKTEKELGQKDRGGSWNSGGRLGEKSRQQLRAESAGVGAWRPSASEENRLWTPRLDS